MKKVLKQDYVKKLKATVDRGKIDIDEFITSLEARETYLPDETDYYYKNLIKHLKETKEDTAKLQEQITALLAI